MHPSPRSFALTALIALAFGFAGAAVWSLSGLGDRHTRDYLLAHPELLPQMADAYQRQQRQGRLAGVANEVTKPFAGATLGNPDGAITLVEFTDYACGYCRISAIDVAALIKANPDLRVVVRELSIFEGSDKPALMALAAAKQGKFAAFHHAMFAGGAPTSAAIDAAAQEAGIDLAMARAFAQTSEGQAELAKNSRLADHLGFSGTPSWVIGDQAMEGAIGLNALQEAVDEARKQ